MDDYTKTNLPIGGEKIARDPRLAELRKIGIKRIWLQVAERIGVDAFLEMWRILDDCDERKKGAYLYIPTFSTFLRYQRNQFIRTLAGAGLPSAAIRDRVKRDLRERLSLRHVDRVAAGAKESDDG